MKSLRAALTASGSTSEQSILPGLTLRALIGEPVLMGDPVLAGEPVRGIGLPAPSAVVAKVLSKPERRINKKEK